MLINDLVGSISRVSTSPRRLRTVITIGLVLLCLIAFSEIWRNGFIDYDDQTYITANPYVHNGLTRDGIVWALTAFIGGNWHPLTNISWLADGSLSHFFSSDGGMVPAVFHGQNLFWHIGTTILIFLTLTRVTDRTWPSALVAALFAVHPLHVESVAWAAERKDVLCGFFWMLTVYAYVRYTESPHLLQYLLVLIFFTLGLLTKPMFVTLPCALLLLDYWPLRRYGWKNTQAIPGAVQPETAGRSPGLMRSVVEKIPLCVLVVIASLVAIQAQTSSHSVASLADLPISARLANAVYSYSWYVGKTFWPFDLAIHYTHAMNDWTWPPVIASIGFIAVLSLLAIFTLRRAPWFAVGWFWFLGTLVPAIGLVQVGAMARADRYTYIPHIGFFLALVWTGAALADRWKVGRTARVVLVAGSFLVLTIAASIQVGYWRDRETIWIHAAEVTEGNHYVYSRAGGILSAKFYSTGRADDLDRSLSLTREAVRLKPGTPDYENNLGVALLLYGKIDEAEPHFRIAVDGWPNYLEALLNLGTVEYLRKNYLEAERVLRRAVEQYPQAANMRAVLGDVFWELGKRDEAGSQWSSALAIDSNLPNALLGLGRIELFRGNNEEGARKFQAAVSLNPSFVEAYSQLGIAAGRLNRWDKSVAAHSRAVEIASNVMTQGPERAVYLRRLAFAMHSSKLTANAQHVYRECSKMDPDWMTKNLETAWNNATAPVLSPGVAATSYELASEVCQASQSPSARSLDVLAAALAALGRFEDAAVTSRQALLNAPTDQSGAIAVRLSLYEKKERYTDK